MRLLPLRHSASSSAAAAAPAGEGSTCSASSSCKSSSSSSVSEIPNSAASASDSSSSSSILTHPSLPSPHALLPPLQPSRLLSASFLRLSSLTSASSTSGASALATSAVSHLLYAATESLISVYDISNLRRIDSLPSPRGAGAAKSVSLSTDGTTIFIAHQDGRIRLWRRSRQSGLLRLHTSLPTPSDRLLRLPLPKNYVTVRRHRKRLWIEHADAISAVAAAGDRLYSVSWDKTLKIWSTTSLRCLESVAAHEDAVNAVAVADDGTVYTGSADRRIRVWAIPARAKRHELVATLDQHRSAVNALALNSDGSLLYSGACDRSILVWERDESSEFMKVTGALRGHEKAILSLACAREIVVSGSADRTVRVWRRATEGREYCCLAVLEGHASGVRSLVAVRMPAAGGGGGGGGEHRIFSGSLDGEVCVWRVLISSATNFGKNTSEITKIGRFS
ncbi:Dynein assembly factor with WDR repeat domains 1 [Apostasia shenzhenica]|uniref:Dynein assembly factor with WDR repeat domains 1 n=1 Tax=Apostasia shenzhenica TaxID=1088818 RepID=A0A2I0BE87_9ASPA|nr:Dynein assembly factor with WDR repeat domains 1 [Apostasia shenzhenica]